VQDLVTELKMASLINAHHVKVRAAVTALSLVMKHTNAERRKEQSKNKMKKNQLHFKCRKEKQLTPSCAEA
jgi:hypothetical protein